MTNENLLNKVTQGDCLEVMKNIEDKSIDMILCDLPYGTTANKWDSIIPLDEIWDEYSRIIKDNGAIILTSAQPFTSVLINSNLKNFKYTWVWDKAHPTGHLNAKRQPLRQTEDICVFYKKQCTYNPEMEVRGKPRKKGGYIKGNGTDNYRNFKEVVSYNNEYYPSNILKISNANRTNRLHPTQKPVDLGRYLIRTYTNEGETVLDNTCGSGSFLVASVLEGRNFIGIEQEPEYVEISNTRIAEVLKEKELQQG